MAKPQNEQNDTDESNTSGYQNFWLPDYGVSVRARTIDEAVAKAEKQTKNDEEQK